MPSALSHSPITIAIVGATGAVGDEFLRLLSENRLPVKQLIAIASPSSAGKTVMCGTTPLTVQALSKEAFKGVDIAFFSAGASISREWASVAAAAGCVIIDNSSAFRMDPEVPLVVPEVNDHLLHKIPARRIFANPNCTTAIMLMAVAPLHKKVGVKAIIASSYQAASGAGAKAMAELEQQTKQWMVGRPIERHVLPQQIAFNVFPHIDKFEPDLGGYTKEEAKLVNETRKILEAPNIKVTGTCVRVPVLRAHSVSASVWLNAPLTPEQARAAIAGAPGVVVIDDPAAAKYPTPWEMAGKNECAVGRIRKDNVFEPGIALWVVGDQLLKGAAWNALQIAQGLLEKGAM